MQIEGAAEVGPHLPFGVEPKLGSVVEITIPLGRSGHVLRIEHGARGERSLEYRVNGRRRELDEEARRLFEEPARALGMKGTLTGQLSWEYDG